MKIPISVIALALVMTGCGASEDTAVKTSDFSAAETTAGTSITDSAETLPEIKSTDVTSDAAVTEVTVSDVAEPVEFPDEAYVETGTFNQYSCTLAGSTACGATAGTLILQSISYVSGEELSQRMETIRNYSELGDEFSCGAPQYYLCGYQISNSLNKYIEEKELSKNRLTNFRTDRSTEDTLIELIATGRPAVLEVCYRNGNVLSDFQGYSHWICINGYKKTESGTQFRYSDTIAVSENWVDSELLDKSNANVSYGDFYIQPERYICSFEEPLI